MTVRPPLALRAASVEPRRKPSNYPKPFSDMMAGRVKHPLGDAFGLSNFGVNLTRLGPGARSALLHRHSRQDEFVFVLQGELTLITDEGEAVMRAGDCAGFPAGGRAHHLVNRSRLCCVYLEVGDRLDDDMVAYPEDDLVADRTADGWRFTHKNGEPY